MKNKILNITVECRLDECPDTSYLGEYTDRADEWNIDRETGRFVHAETLKQDLIDQLEEKISELEETVESTLENEAEINRLNKRIEKIECSLDKSPIGRNQFRYFTPYAAGEKPGTPEYKKYATRDYRLMESYNNGDWWYVGIIAKASIKTETGTIQHITSGGLWGIESTDHEYMKEVAEEEIESLKNELSALGYSDRAITYAVNGWNQHIISK